MLIKLLNKKQCHLIVESVKKYRKHKFISFKASNGGTMILSKCAICGSKKPRFMKNKKQKDY